MSAEILQEAEERVKTRVELCNKRAKALAAQVNGLLASQAEDVLNVEPDRIMRLSMELVEAQGALREAYNMQQRLKRNAI